MIEAPAIKIAATLCKACLRRLIQPTQVGFVIRRCSFNCRFSGLRSTVYGSPTHLPATITRQAV